ncbi:polysaccharide pyruvyl transferase family protein [Paenibacillus odorifer]|uniref:Polysaccharide pyruvyl transferase domain-containing protein n=1 Tax=Paenibacillus odorifer TaxID=189426 RepID=A0A1R0XSH9_9BACL|nr:polysaccharide pyruvyl transferase family protein [Paenibacillus odorifer]OMD37949.1 hypothetical protein BSK52_20325 [Paenibacillus odorifer]
MNILVSAYLDNNIGDDLMIILLSKKFPEHNFYLTSSNSTVKRTFESFDNIIFHELDLSDKYLKKFSVFLSIGGSLFNDMNGILGGIRRIRRIRVLRLMKKKNIKIATIGCNLGPYKNSIGPLLTKIELKQNSLTTVRDKESFHLIQKFKKVKNYHLAPDIVYNLSNLYELPYGNQQNILGISAYRSTTNHEYNYSNYIFLASVSDKFIEQTGGIVRLFAFDTENENDLSSAYHIKENSLYPDKIQIIPYIGNYIDFIQLMSECSRFISIRFHSAILCEMLKIPFLPIVYSNKMDNYLDDLHFSGIRISINNIPKSSREIEEITACLIENQQIFNDFSNDHQLEFEKHFNELGKLLK